MATTFTTPNMGLVLPVVGQELGPQWATDLFNSLSTTLDLHNHTAGKGVQVPSAGININADLGFGGFNATNFRSVRLANQGAPLSLGTDIGCLYESGGELYYNDSSARQVKLTNVGAGNFAFLAYPERTPAISGTFTILSTDAFSLYYVDTSGGTATVNLPASSAVAVGRTYLFDDIKRNAGVNNITIVPNGTDKINTVAASYVIGNVGSLTALTTDGAGNWYAHTTSSVLFDPQNMTTNLQWVTGQVSPSLLQSGFGPSGGTAQSILFQPQAANATNGTPGGLGFNLGNPTGTGTNAFFFGQQNGVQFFRIGKGGANANHYSIWLGDTTGGGGAANDWCLSNQGGGALSINAPSGNIAFSTANGNPVFTLASAGLTSGSISVAISTGTVTLGGAQFLFPYIILTGSLTGNVTVVLPTVVGATWIVDATAVTLNAHTITLQANAIAWGTTVGVTSLYQVTYGGTGKLYGVTLTP